MSDIRTPIFNQGAPAIGAAVYDEDIYADSAILEPYGHYRAIRHLAPAVWLPRHRIWAMGRHGDVTAALRNHAVFSSASGVAVSEATNNMARGTTISSDPPEHERLRKIIAAPLTPAAVADLRPQLETAAESLVADLVARGAFDAATDLAQHLPLAIVSQLVGLPDEGREKMLDWAGATFDIFGPENERTRQSRPVVHEMREYVNALASRDKLRAGSWADRLLDHVQSGAVPRDQFSTLLRDYLGPSLDTTIFATANLIWLFSLYPDQWDMVREDPALVRNAISECVRLESPIRGFTRKLSADLDIGDARLPQGARVLLLYASANRDERRWDQPEVFDVRRRTLDQVGFGMGVHSCAGMHLARAEIECLVRALIPRVRRFEAGLPVRAVNNTLRGLASLPVRVLQ